MSRLAQMILTTADSRRQERLGYKQQNLRALGNIAGTLAGMAFKGPEEEQEKAVDTARRLYYTAQTENENLKVTDKRRKIDEERNYGIVLDQSRKADLTDNETMDKLAEAGLAHLAPGFQKDSIKLKADALAEESKKWQAATDKADTIGIEVQGINSQQDWDAFVSKYKQQDIDVEEGLTGGWKSGKDKLLSLSKKAQDLQMSKNKAAFEVGASKLDKLRIRREQIVKQGKDSGPIDTEIEAEKANRSSIIDAREQRMSIALQKRDKEYADTAISLVANLFTTEEQESIQEERALKAGNTSLVSYVSSLLLQGAPLLEVVEWASGGVRIGDPDESWFSWDDDEILFEKNYKGSFIGQGGGTSNTTPAAKDKAFFMDNYSKKYPDRDVEDAWTRYNSTNR